MSAPDKEWYDAVWDYVTKADEREKTRERAAESRHKEVVAALDKVSRAVSGAVGELRRAA